MHRILVADDEPGIRDIIHLSLSRINIAVDQAESGAHALQLLKTHRPSLVIADLRLPDMDGAELVHKIRLDAPSLPIVLVSASPDLEHMAAHLQVNAFLEKPFRLYQLQSLIQSILAQVGEPRDY